MNRTLTLFKDRLKKKGLNPANASPTAEVMCDLLDEANQLHWYDRNALTEEVKRLKARLDKLETKGQDE